LEELTHLPIIRHIVNTWQEALRVPMPEAPVFRLMRQVLYKHSVHSSQLTINKHQFYDFLREFLGVRMDVDEETVAQFFGSGEGIDYETFSQLWRMGPGKNYVEDMLLKDSVLAASCTTSTCS
jgi:hypothetical protein